MYSTSIVLTFNLLSIVILQSYLKNSNSRLEQIISGLTYIDDNNTLIISTIQELTNDDISNINNLLLTYTNNDFIEQEYVNVVTIPTKINFITQNNEFYTVRSVVFNHYATKELRHCSIHITSLSSNLINYKFRIVNVTNNKILGQVVGTFTNDDVFIFDLDPTQLCEYGNDILELQVSTDTEITINYVYFILI